jgi:hypothetical protein
MARRPHPDNYVLDFESAYNEHHALVVSAVRTAGLAKYIPLARLVFNMQWRSEGRPLEWPISRYAQEFDRDERTIQRWLGKLRSIGLIEIEYRPKPRGGQESNRVSINWANVRTFAIHREGCEGGDIKMSPRPGKVSPRPGVLSPSSNESPSESPSLEHNTSTTTALPHARTCSESEEEEDFIKKLSAECRRLVPTTPRFLEGALRKALAAGCPRRQLADRCKWFHQNRTQWERSFQPGVFHDGIADALPDMPAHQGWPYQR